MICYTNIDFAKLKDGSYKRKTPHNQAFAADAKSRAAEKRRYLFLNIHEKTVY